jgi:hypothetical protein
MPFRSTQRLLRPNENGEDDARISAEDLELLDQLDVDDLRILENLRNMLHLLQLQSNAAGVLTLESLEAVEALQSIPEPRLCRTFYSRRIFIPEHFLRHTAFTEFEANGIFHFIGDDLKRRTLSSHALMLKDIFVTAMAVLRYGGTFEEIGMLVGVSPQTASRVLHEFVDSVIDKMGHFVTVQGGGWEKHQQHFLKKFGLPYAFF